MRTLSVILCLAGSLAWADRGPKVEYYVSAGPAFSMIWGGLTGSSYVQATDSLKNSEITWVPKPHHSLLFAGAVGALIDASDVSMVLDYGPVKSDYALGTTDGSLLLVAFQYVYQFGYTQPWRLRVGANYAFSRLSVPGVAEYTEAGGNVTIGDAVYSGNGPGLSLGAGWALNQDVMLVADLRARVVWWSNIVTDQYGFSEFDEPLNSFLLEPTLQVRWIF